MKVLTIPFKTKGYDPFIDFLKAYSILCVLFGHTFPYLNEVGYMFWAGMQVPIFILVQVFNVFKKEHSEISLIKIFRRVLCPFLIIQSIIFVAMYFIHNDWGIKGVIYNGLYYGGYGPGAYYPWIYLQFALLLPILHPYIKRFSKITLFLGFVIVSVALEIICALSNFPDFLYRLLAIRYIFLIYLGWVWIYEGIVLSVRNILLGIIGMLCIYLFGYQQLDLTPYFYNTSWHSHRWICFFYVVYLLVPFLYYLWNCLNKNSKISSIISLLAKCSYEIFLIQMLIIALYPQSFISYNNVGSELLYAVIVFSTSISLGILSNRLYARILNKLHINK